MGDYEKAAPWSASSVKGCKRFIDRTWGLQDILVDGDAYSKELETAFHKTIKKVTEDIENMKFNTAIAALMTLLNTIYDKGAINKAELKTFVTLLNPFAPHVTEEIWAQQGFGGMLANGNWVDFDEAKCVDDEIEIVAQINGKVRAKLMIPAEIEAADAIALAKKELADSIEGKQIVKELYVKGRLVNIVVR
jgi:leucyl-tRNA synthetase